MFKKKNPRNLYYLFPVSRKGSRARYFRHLAWSIITGLIFAALLGAAIYFFNAL